MMPRHDHDESLFCVNNKPWLGDPCMCAALAVQQQMSLSELPATLVNLSPCRNRSANLQLTCRRVRGTDCAHGETLSKLANGIPMGDQGERGHQTWRGRAGLSSPALWLSCNNLTCRRARAPAQRPSQGPRRIADACRPQTAACVPFQRLFACIVDLAGRPLDLIGQCSAALVC